MALTESRPENILLLVTSAHLVCLLEARCIVGRREDKEESRALR